jgi:hypothetical protein
MNLQMRFEKFADKIKLSEHNVPIFRTYTIGFVITCARISKLF